MALLLVVLGQRLSQPLTVYCSEPFEKLLKGRVNILHDIGKFYLLKVFLPQNLWVDFSVVRFDICS
jgi:hypothetical protein